MHINLYMYISCSVFKAASRGSEGQAGKRNHCLVGSKNANVRGGCYRILTFCVWLLETIGPASGCICKRMLANLCTSTAFLKGATIQSDAHLAMTAVIFYERETIESLQVSCARFWNGHRRASFGKDPKMISKSRSKCNTEFTSCIINLQNVCVLLQEVLRALLLQPL